MTSYSEAIEAFGQHIRHGGDWLYASYVAQWVKQGAGQSARGSRSAELSDEKVSAKRFADDASVSANTVTKYLKAWDNAAAHGVVPSSGSIHPGEDIELDVTDLPEWSDFYRAANTPAMGGKDSEAEPMKSVARIKFFKAVGRLSEVTQFQAEDVVSLLEDSAEDYEHIEQQVMAATAWLNRINELRMGATPNNPLRTAS